MAVGTRQAKAKLSITYNLEVLEATEYTEFKAIRTVYGFPIDILCFSCDGNFIVHHKRETRRWSRGNARSRGAMVRMTFFLKILNQSTQENIKK